MIGQSSSKIVEQRRKSKDRNTITVIVLGDEGVGKSSLVSTFVSRHFSEMAPGIMTKVRLPPDNSTLFKSRSGTKKKGIGGSSGAGCVTTIVDTQRGDTEFVAGVSPFSSPMSTSQLSESDNEALPMKSIDTTSKSIFATNLDNVDVIVLVYDLARAETFNRLEGHWLPLIEQYYNGEIPVVIAGNKLDLVQTDATDNQARTISRQQIVSLLQRFTFVRQSIKCCAKTLLNVNDVFVKAQHTVLYPINPLYNLSEGKLTPQCEKAFTRIFRMFDEDFDGLLSNSELNAFQSHLLVPMMEGDLGGWKKVLSKNNPEEAVVRDGKFTVFGFLAIFDVFINSDRLEIPWVILRAFGYDDDLKLNIPSSVTEGGHSWQLSSSAKRFLTSVFHQFASNNRDEILLPKDVLSIFSILQQPSLPPWHPFRVNDVLKGCYSSPRIYAKKITQVAEMNNFHDRGSTSLTLTSPEAFLSSMSLNDWIGHWHMLSSIGSSVTKIELYKLGHVEVSKDAEHEEGTRNRRIKPIFDHKSIPSNAIRVMVAGSSGCGKSAFIGSLCHREGITNEYENTLDYLNTNPTLSPETDCVHVQYANNEFVSNGKKGGMGSNITHNVVELIFTETPILVNKESWDSELISLFSNKDSREKQGFDMTILVFDSNDPSSLAFAINLEKRVIKDDTPRVYIGTKIDKEKQTTCKKGRVSENKEHEDVVGQKVSSSDVEVTKDAAIRHCLSLDIEPPLMTSACNEFLGGIGPKSSNLRAQVLEHLARCALGESDPNRLRAIPHAEKKRREKAKRKKIIWIGSLVSATLIVGVGMLFSQKKNKVKMFWWKHLFGRHKSGVSDSSSKNL